MNPTIYRVIKNCKFIGYLISFGIENARFQAFERYGKDCWVEIYHERL